MSLPRGAMGLSLQFVVVVFPDHTHLLFLSGVRFLVTRSMLHLHSIYKLKKPGTSRVDLSSSLDWKRHIDWTVKKACSVPLILMNRLNKTESAVF